MPITLKKSSVYSRPKVVDPTPWVPDHPELPPTITINYPTAGATLSGSSIVFLVTAADDNGLAGVQYKLDGADIGSEITLAPYSLAWDSTTVANGSHTLVATARDTSGNSTVSNSITFTVSNVITLPDVIVTNLTYSNGVFTSTVQNTGTEATPSDKIIGVGYKVDGVSVTWGSTATPLAAGATTTIGTQGGNYTIPSGTHTISALVDDINRFSELDESNNTYSTSITITTGTDDAASKFYPGHYMKVEGWQVQIDNGVPNKTGGNSLATIIGTAAANYKDGELYTIPALRGVKWTFAWGEMETSADINTWQQMKTINYILSELYKFHQANPTLDKKRLILAIGMKGGPVSQILPYDMRGFKSGSTTLYTYAWKHSSNNGYYPKLWDVTVQSRLNTFVQKLSTYIPPNMDGKTLDTSDYVCQWGTLESATEAPAAGYDGGSLLTYEKGLRDFAGYLKTHFVKTPVFFSLNYKKDFVHRCITGIGTSDWTGLESKKIGINTPNGCLAGGLVINGTPPGSFPGILRYFMGELTINTGVTKNYIGNIGLNPEVQGDEYLASDGYDARERVRLEAKKDMSPDYAYIDAQYDFPSYESIYIRQRDVLHANIIVWQRTQPFWSAGTPFVASVTLSDGSKVSHTWPGNRPKVVDFLKTNEAINSNISGGLSTIKPTNWI